jgi:glucans biosynthesis protein C
MTQTAHAHTSSPTPSSWVESRLPYLDNLKVALIAAIIALHGVASYAGSVEAWTYSGVREVTLAPATEIVISVVAAPFGLFLIALLFLVAGLLTPPSRARKGTARFTHDRLLRLGIPFAAYVLVIQPLLVYAGARLIGLPQGGLREEWFGPENRLDTGPLWFVGVLLVFSLGYAAWYASVRRPPGRHLAQGAGRRYPRPITARTLAAVAVVVAPASFAIRLVYPYGSESGVSDLNFWEWPACLAVFALGIIAAEQGWLTEVPAGLARRSGVVTGVGVAAMAGLLVVAGLRGGIDDLLGGWSPLAMAFAGAEAILTVFGSVWLLAVVQRRFDRHYRFGPELARSAYGAFIVQTLFLLGFAILLRPVGVPAEAKALLVATGGVVCSFGAAWLLVRWVPVVRRIL